MESHPAAALFPLMSGEEYRGLVEDIRVNGLHEPITVLDGKVLDGRNRLRACEELGIVPEVREWDGEGPVVDYVVSLNLHRRHLTATQRAVVGHDLLPWYESEAKARQLETLKQNATVPVNLPERERGEAREKAAERVQVSPSYVQSVKRIADTAPELLPQMRSGEITLTEAKRQARNLTMAESPPMPSDKYRVLYVDPPWSYPDRGDIGDSYGDAKRHYPALTVEELMLLPVKTLADDNSVLFLWSTSPKLEEALQLCHAWGFRYTGASFVWDKIKHNFGHYNSVRHELLLICVRGSCQPDSDKLIDSVQSIERTAHSVKPEEFRTIIDTMYTNGKRIELFARGEIAEGWEGWGNESSSTIS